MSAGFTRNALTSIPAARYREASWLLLAFLWLAATAWVRPLTLPDEGRYVGVAWEMLRSGDWLTPTLNGLPFFHKPPLFYWITAASMALFGPNEWAARAAPLLGGLIGAASLFLFVCRWVDARTARAALLALLAQPLFFVGAQFANMDMLVAGLISATVLLLADAVLRIEQRLPHAGALLGAYALAALAVLAKGLIGVVLPGLVLVIALLISRRARVVLRLLSLRGVALLLVIAAPWFIAIQSKHPGFFDYFFVEQHFRRYVESGFNNVQPFWFYPALLMALALPWWPWLWRALRGAQARERTTDFVRVLMWVWAAVVVLFFSLPASKLVGYVLPAVPPLAFFAAQGWVGSGSALARGRAGWAFANALLVVTGLAAIGWTTMHPTHSTRELARVLQRERVADEPVLMIERYAYDLPLYARLAEGVSVGDDWSDASIQQHDNWRNELADAGTFAPLLAAQRLISLAELDARLCAAPVSWVVAALDAPNRFPVMAQATRVATTHEAALWRVERGTTIGPAAKCPASADRGAAPR